MKMSYTAIMVAAWFLTVEVRAPVWAESARASSPPSASYYTLAVRWSPIIIQDVGCPNVDGIMANYGDYITRIDYDGDYVGNNNWDNLGYPNKSCRLPAYVYYALMETQTHYFIWYALFHPADDFHCSTGWADPFHSAYHENDLEGIVMCVYKDGSRYGKLQLVQLEAHNDFYQYRGPAPFQVDDGHNGDTDDIDGTIRLQSHPLDDMNHPAVWVEGGGHGIRRQDTGDWPSVKYYFKGFAEDPDDPGVSQDYVGYDLLSISAEMWEQRTNPGDKLFQVPPKEHQGYYGRRFSVHGLYRKLDGDNYGGPEQGPDMASAPWNWDDNDDGPWGNGDWFMDPADYHTRLTWDVPFSTEYIFHPFGYDNGLDHLGGDIYNGSSGTTTLRYGPYRVVTDVTILDDQTLQVDPGRKISCNRGTKFICDGRLSINGEGNAVRVVSHNDATTGMRITGRLVAGNGAVIKMH